MPFVFHSSYKNVKGFLTVYHDALRYAYMITQQAKQRMRTLAFWQKHGLPATQDAFKVKRRTLFNWQQRLQAGHGQLEALNPKSRAPLQRRRRLWPPAVLDEIKRLRIDHPNLGKEKLHPELISFCTPRNLKCPQAKTIGRLIKDLGGLRTFPQRVSHFGKVKAVKRTPVLRKPKGLKALYPGHLVALDTIEEHVWGLRRYVLTFEDIYSRFSFAWATTSHASKAAAEFFEYCLKVFPVPLQFVLTDNGSEFKKHFSEALKQLYLTHYRTYPKTPKMNAHLERFNRTLQEEFLNFKKDQLRDPDVFNGNLMDYLVWYNTRRVHYAFNNKLSPLQFLNSLTPNELHPALGQKCKRGWPYTEFWNFDNWYAIIISTCLILTVAGPSEWPYCLSLS